MCCNRGICQSRSLIDTFGEYSPQNTDFVRILSDLGTPSQTNVKKRVNSVQEDHEVTFSQSSQHGEYILQQDMIEKLDHDYQIHASSIVINRYSNFGNTYLSKECARVLGPGQIVTSLEHLAQCRCVQVTTMWSGPNTRAAILTNKYFQKLYNVYQ